MLKLQNVTKIYGDKENAVRALKGVSVTFRKSEFVSILGQSGCGKTTLMNIIGGLDRATDGDISIDGVSTVDFSDAEWDEYRNSKIGFIFQSYNLISHLNVLDNVELALTISGLNGSEKTEKAKQALDKVGLKDQYHKKPNQLSGGQMQRVAIARAIVNQPEILLADEPTGAIDSETSVQIMEILRDIAKDKLVIMVTHNNELAEAYSNRIVKILDGNIVSDSNPVEEVVDEADAIEEPAPKRTKAKKHRAKRNSMSFATAIKLSWKNLINKRGRSIMTIIAGCITVISLALILAVNNGFAIYIDDFEEKSMSKYPITISSGENSIMAMFEEFLQDDNLTGDSVSISSIFEILNGEAPEKDKFTDEQIVYIYGMFSKMFQSMLDNDSKDFDISTFKRYLDNDFDKSLGTVKFDYSLNLNIFKENQNGTYMQLNPLSKSGVLEPLFSMIGGDESSTDRMTAMMAAIDRYAFWDELIADDKMIESQYETIAGHLPKNMNEIVLVIDEYNQISDFDAVLLNHMGLADLVAAAMDTKNLDNYATKFNDMLGKEFVVLPTSSAYSYNEDTRLYESFGTYEQSAQSQILRENGIKVRISGILRSKGNVDGCIKGVVGYSSALGDYIVNDANESAFIKAQRASYENYVSLIEQSEAIIKKMDKEFLGVEDLSLQEQLILAQASAAKITDVRTGEEIDRQTYSSIINDNNARAVDKPSYIYIYPKTIESKAKIVSAIRAFNAKCAEDELAASKAASASGNPAPTTTGVVDFTDDLDSVVGELNGMVNTITYILIAVALVAVLVTMLLIAIIMYISVQDRTREIGILRSLGARKGDISNIFNVETMLLGLFAGVVGVALAAILQFPINLIFGATLGISGLLKIAWWHPLVLIVGAVVIIVISGLIPSIMAAKKDPVIALRSE
ncbi:MAG: ATP-binding cassette domain-containing protein [Bacteroides sp.]|nr:ATP-binding cassette domain-containing protein [Bacillota bacterium]MCM1393399.1 ATP-binding cassette domain-containing protein [[Eubacterium] siraeum]MCM1456112.1 ATP-binding cassette domain-containing protein [Bacteroides sp.]